MKDGKWQDAIDLIAQGQCLLTQGAAGNDDRQKATDLLLRAMMGAACAAAQKELETGKTL